MKKKTQLKNKKQLLVLVQLGSLESHSYYSQFIYLLIFNA